ncbi:MAG TPA: hypothetical protein V6C84_00725 [Coleofasciculaceae cyanobacterium]|jgi:hypothetical protein
MVTVKTGYKPQSEDTHPEADAMFFSLLQKRLNSDRLLMGAGMIRSARRLSLSCLKRDNSHLNPQAFAQKLASAWLQEDCLTGYIPTGNEMTWIQDSIGLAGLLHPLFEALEIPYYITGGVAAIAYGEPRTTRDLDAVLSIFRADIPHLAQALETAGFYVDGRLKTLSITHIESVSRADLILAQEDEFETLKFQRRQLIDIPGIGSLFFASAEDVILSKLQWGRRTQSEKQWRDVLGVFKVKSQSLDLQYLKAWGDRLGVTEEIDRAVMEAGI